MRDEYEKKFHEHMEALARKHERSRVYVDFMDYYIACNSESPGIRDVSDYYDEDDMQHMNNAYKSFTQLMHAILEKEDWHDYIGEYYEEYILAGNKASSKGQFYTPKSISDLLSRLCGTPCVLSEAYDPACGSARNLLDYHSKHPDVRCTGEDLDESACKMAVINFHLHGVNGVVNWIDALTREYMGTSWRVLDGQIYVTDLEYMRATEDLCGALSLLMMNDDVLQRVAQTLQDKHTPPGDTGNTGGLDAWIT